jgi:hypothetical protein
MSGQLNERVEVFSYSDAGSGGWETSKYTRVPNAAAADGAWWAAVEPAGVRESTIAAQSQAEADFAFTFQDGVQGLSAQGALRHPPGPGNPMYKITGDPRVAKKLRRVVVLAVRAGSEVFDSVQE